MERLKAAGRRGRASRLARVFALATTFWFAQAHAQSSWEVHDNKANDHLKVIRNSIGEDDGTVNDRLKKIAKLGSAKTSGEAAEAPTEKLEKDKPSQVEKTVADRCPKGDKKAGEQLWQLCEETVKTQMAKYNYSLAIYEVFNKRKQRLEEIERERANLGSEDQGKLQDNTNKLLALIARMDLDIRQHRLYMDAYDARLQYLTAARDQIGNEVMRGKKGSVLGDTVSNLAGFATMTGVLNAAKSERRPWKCFMRTTGCAEKELERHLGD
ncbi:hypothetical protein [Lysobacter sp. TAB13]|uniref:hypothetical protein n=1 Tax=Lysobacter sp. TAB13 TaxID=3233065 RepID=UPI003F9C6A08